MKLELEDRKGRIEGRAKVTGQAKYSAEYDIPGLAHGVFLTSTISSGDIVKLDVNDALNASGVIDVISHLNTLPIKDASVFADEKVLYSGQPIALVLAESIEEATFAASMIHVEYDEHPFEIDFETEMEKVPFEEKGNERGHVEDWEDAEYKVEEEYSIALEVHNPMEMHATIAQWLDEDHVKIYDKSQDVGGVQWVISRRFDVPEDNIEVTSEFVGGGFGSALRVWYNTEGAVLAAKMLGRPVKVVLTRPQMFTMVGHRPQSWQRVKLGANRSGLLTGIIHQSKQATAKVGQHTDSITRVTRKIYGFENVKTEEALVLLNIPRPTWMRGPGDSTGCFAVESAIDELSYKMNLDPVALRLKNIAPYEMETGLPWSSHYLHECLEKGSELIGWKNRPSQPCKMEEGDWQVGYGVSVGLWNAMRRRAGATMILNRKGELVVQSAMTDIGTGTGQGILNIAHSTTGISKPAIDVQLGDSRFPEAPAQGGSWGLSSVSGAVVVTGRALKKKIAEYAWPEMKVDDEFDFDRITLGDEGVSLDGNNPQVSYESIFDKHGEEEIKITEYAGPGAERKTYGFCSSAAHFYKVKVHKLTRKVKVDRMVIVVDAGKIINQKAAANQVLGAGVGGVGMALLEEQKFDASSGQMIDNDFAGYHFAVNADVPIIEVSFINKPDPHINPSGAKGLGEVGIVGSAAAMANAIYNATGIRVRSLPITPDKLV